MACAKTGSTRLVYSSCDIEPEERERSILLLNMIGNTTGIKELHELWIRSPYEYTCFMLPADSEVSLFVAKYLYDGVPFIKATDFTQFWLSLDDLHKERRLLVAYLCSLRAIKATFGPDQNFEIDIIRDMFTGFLWTVRRLFIIEQNKTGGKKLKIMVARFLGTFLCPLGVDMLDSKLEDDIKDDLKTAMTRMRIRGPRAMYSVIHASKSFFVALFTSLAAMYLHWAVMDLSKAEEYAGSNARWLFDAIKASIQPGQDHEAVQQHYLQKLRAAVPHWRVEDRAYILQVMQTKEKSCKQCYIERLLSNVGPDQFKVIAFGKEKFCSNCGRSSYVLEDRLWSCGLCVKEKVRPKARYCNVACQKAHWLKHKSEDHAQPSCSHCGNKTAALRACKRCREENLRCVASYCSVPCQQADWRKHKSQAHSSKKE